MFCPLCLAEYRDEIAQCGHCRLGLVGSLRQAETTSEELWKGDRQGLADKILTRLDEADIPFHFEQHANYSSGAELLGIPFKRRKSTFEYSVRVLRSDAERARAAMKGLNLKADPSLWADLSWESIAKYIATAFRKP